MDVTLSVLLTLVRGMPSYQGLLQELKDDRGGPKRICLDAAKPYVIAGLCKDLGRPIVVITAYPEGAKQLQEQLLAWCEPHISVHLLPEPDVLPYERLSPDPLITHERLRVLDRLASSDNALFIVVASLYSLVQKTLPLRDFIDARHTIETGVQASPEKLIDRWLSMGYQMERGVEVPGAISRRGGIIDIYPPGSRLPARIEFLGDRVESIRLFDPATQRSQELVNSVTVIPAREMVLPREQRPNGHGVLEELDFSDCAEETRRRTEEEISELLAGHTFEGLEFYASLFHQGTLLEYLPKKALIILDRPSDIENAFNELEAQAGEVREGQINRGELPSNFPTPYLSWGEMRAEIEGSRPPLTLETWGYDYTDTHPERQALSFSPAPNYGGRLKVLLKEIKGMLQDGSRVVIVSHQAARLSELFQEEDIIAPPLPMLEKMPPPGSLTLIQGSLAEGWIMVGGETGEGSALTLLTDVEVFGFAKRRRLSRRRPVRREAFLTELSLGDYAVHVEHGIGRFRGVVRMHREEGEREYLLLEYAQGDKLYVPADQIDRVSPYIGPGEGPPSLTRLGTQEWARVKQRVKESAEEIARELLEIYASREVMSGFVFSQDTPWQQELESSFPYIETPDQMETIREVKEDMEKPKSMDRLVCGDVGYGKTEVALRAAFKAVMDGKQVAMLVPTTVLAQQHLATFTERLEAYPVRVEVLSRFRSDKEQGNVLRGLESGAVDICIGTHRLLQKDVYFKDLGLVIIDEEQRFGVAHKERLKQMRKEVDVLTLSATPIPRTLHMSLVGVRDMSTMETPPEERLPIKTYVSPYDERLIREAIIREMERGGQVFFVHNRVQTIGHMARRLMRLVPEAKITVGHGQMPEERLEAVMLDFSQGNYDVLVCSTIIESGLDMPNVNTIIVNDAERLGLAQLYQLRGRVGRGANRAYGYFLFPKDKPLTEASEKRLKTIQAATELGAGFRIALKDLEIRGAGNLLGVEQSGHIAAVGFDLYCRLLAEAVEELKAQEKTDGKDHGLTGARTPPITVDIPIPAHIPEEYVPDLDIRLALYQRLAKLASSEEVDSMAQELKDRFGELPPETINLLYLIRLKALSLKAGVYSIAKEGREIVLKMVESVNVDRISLPRTFNEGVKVGIKQIRVDSDHFGERWQEALESVLTEMAHQKVAS
ncbi:MAG: transcription-repair coupling factor [Dehalococcoidia bacterium]